MSALPESERRRAASGTRRSTVPVRLRALFLLAIASCGHLNSVSADDERSERVAYVRQIVAEQARLATISHRLAVHGADLCGPIPRYATGAYLYDWDLSTDEWIDAANDALGINFHLPGIEVLMVIPESPADTAGLEAGDRIKRLGAWRVPAGRGALAAFNRRLNALMRSGVQTVELGIERRGEFRSVAVTPIPACSYPTILADDDRVNAFADGQSIVVLRGMLEFTASDDDLAVVVGHELAHNALGHIEAVMESATAGALVGLAVDVLVAATLGVQTNVGRVVGADVGAHVFSDEHQAQADYLGLYFVARAGYDFENATDFLRRFAEALAEAEGPAHGRSVDTGRAAAMARYTREIRRSRARGEPLVPAAGGRRPP